MKSECARRPQRNILIAAQTIFQSQNEGTEKLKEVFDMPQLVDTTLFLLQEESACQQTESDSDIDDDDTQHDKELMDAVSVLLPAFAKSMGSHFAPIFAKLYDPLMKFDRASRPPQEREMVVACLAEVAQEYVAYFGNLTPYISESDAIVARMIMAHPEHVPLNQVLPVFLKVLPLKEDHEESMAVYSCISTLVLSTNPLVVVALLAASGAFSVFHLWGRLFSSKIHTVQTYVYLLFIEM
ncbi:hypothetical protein F2P56_029134, partial [Juglans regia]